MAECSELSASPETPFNRAHRFRGNKGIWIDLLYQVFDLSRFSALDAAI
jgi:hypothetical protein